jgi:outer membrane cobalamin receptor
MVLRQELNDVKLSPLLGMLGSQFRLLDQGLTVNLSAARNYRYPTLNDRYWFPGGNPDLRPELSQSIEANLTFSKSRMENSLVLSLGGYYNHVRDWILWVPSTTAIWHPENVQTVNAKGLEANLKAIHQMGSIYIYLVGNYNLSHTQDQDGQQLIYTPRHNAFGRLMLRKGAWNVQYSQDWNSRRYTVVDNSAWLKGFTTGDLSLGWKLPQAEVLDQFGNMDSRSGPKDRMGLQIQLGMRNLWNLQYQTVASRPMPGRSVFIRLDWDLAAKGRW